MEIWQHRCLNTGARQNCINAQSFACIPFTMPRDLGGSKVCPGPYAAVKSFQHGCRQALECQAFECQALECQALECQALECQALECQALE